MPWPLTHNTAHVLRSQFVPRSLIFGACTLASFLPERVFSILSALLLLLMLLAVYILPAGLHILFHNLFRPSAIIVSPGQPNPFDSSAADTSQAGQIDSEGLRSLLLAKEQRMQKRRLLRRLLWDAGAWSLVLASMVWFVGLVASWWWW